MMDRVYFFFCVFVLVTVDRIILAQRIPFPVDGIRMRTRLG